MGAWAWHLGAFVLALLGLALGVHTLRGDRSRGRVRCPRCWYDMSALARTGEPVPTCPECGRTPRDERALFRTRRSWGRAGLGMALALAGWYVHAVGPGYAKNGWPRLIPSLAIVCLPLVDPADWHHFLVHSYSRSDSKLTIDFANRFLSGELPAWEQRVWLWRLKRVMQSTERNGENSGAEGASGRGNPQRTRRVEFYEVADVVPPGTSPHIDHGYLDVVGLMVDASVRTAWGSVDADAYVLSGALVLEAPAEIHDGLGRLVALVRAADATGAPAGLSDRARELLASLSSTRLANEPRGESVLDVLRDAQHQARNAGVDIDIDPHIESALDARRPPALDVIAGVSLAEFLNRLTERVGVVAFDDRATWTIANGHAIVTTTGRLGEVCVVCVYPLRGLDPDANQDALASTVVGRLPTGLWTMASREGCDLAHLDGRFVVRAPERTQLRFAELLGQSLAENAGR